MRTVRGKLIFIVDSRSFQISNRKKCKNSRNGPALLDYAFCLESNSAKNRILPVTLWKFAGTMVWTYTFFFYKHRVYKHIRLRFTEILSTLLSTLQPEIWLESNFTRKFFRRGLIFTQILIFLSYFYQKLYIKYFVLFIFYKYAF